MKKEPEPTKIIQQSAEITPPTDSTSWSVVPFKNPTYASPVIPATNISKESSLTWWKDPENPTERIALDDV